MRQTWGKLLFMHWRINEALLRPLIPERLTIDTFQGSAWIGVTPFTMWGVRPTFTPPVPFLSEFHELNVRTYVHLEGVPALVRLARREQHRDSLVLAHLSKPAYFNPTRLEEKGAISTTPRARTAARRVHDVAGGGNARSPSPTLYKILLVEPTASTPRAATTDDNDALPRAPHQRPGRSATPRSVARLDDDRFTGCRALGEPRSTTR